MIELIPAIDIIDGKCVRLSQGKYESKKTYNENPLDVAKDFEAHGIKRLHMVDLDGAASSHIINYQTLSTIASHTSLTIDFGGGIKTDEDITIAFENGAEMVTLGSIAVKQPERFYSWLERYGNQRIILGADAKDGKIAVYGWKEQSAHELMPFLESYINKGVTKVLCTDISRDGMLQGPSTTLYHNIMKTFPDLYLIASGGVSDIADIDHLNKAGIPAVVFGKALYEGRIKLEELNRFLISTTN